MNTPDKVELKNTVIDQMRQAVTRRDSFPLNLSGASSDFRIVLGDTINLNPNLDYEIALIRFESYNSIYNITAKNNNFRYFNGTAWKIITITPGAYDVTAITSDIQRQMKANGDVSVTGTGASALTTYNFNLYPNLNTLKSIIDLTNNYQVDFNDTTNPNNLRSLLGYNQGIYSGLYNQSQNIIMIQPFNSIFVNCDLCANSYLNANNIQSLRTFSSNPVPAGYKIIIEPFKPIWVSVIKTKTSFNDYHVWVTDENGNLINFNGENISISLWLRSV